MFLFGNILIFGCTFILTSFFLANKRFYSSIKKKIKYKQNWELTPTYLHQNGNAAHLHFHTPLFICVRVRRDTRRSKKAPNKIKKLYSIKTETKAQQKGIHKSEEGLTSFLFLHNDFFINLIYSILWILSTQFIVSLIKYYRISILKKIYTNFLFNFLFTTIIEGHNSNYHNS